MKSKQLTLIPIFLISFAIYFVSTEHLFPTVGWPTGDEPYYLLIAHSLVHDGDFELTNNFEQHDYLAFYPGDLFPRHEAITPRPLLVSKHTLGLPLLIAPAYALGGWQLAAHMLNLLGALLAVNLFLLARDVSGDGRVALLVWAALAFAAPIFTYAELIFPEVPAALLIIYAYRHLRAWDSSSRLQKIMALLCVAYLPWLHPRLLLVTAGLALYLTAQVARPFVTEQRNDGRLIARLLIASIPLLVSAALFVAYNDYIYAEPLPNYADHAGTGTPPEILGALFGLFLDQQWGLLNHAPVYLLAFGSLIFDLQSEIKNQKSKINDQIWLTLLILPYFLLVVQYKYWWGEWCPPARYLTPILPLLVGPLALALVRLRNTRFYTTFTVLMVLSWGVALAFAVDGRLMYNHPLGKSALLVALGNPLGVDLTRFEPSFIFMFLKDVNLLTWLSIQSGLTLLWIAVLSLIALGAFGIRWSSLGKGLTLMGKFSIIRSTSPQEE